MGCPEHGNWEFIDGILQCPVCGRRASYQAVPDHATLLSQYTELNQQYTCLLQTCIEIAEADDISHESIIELQQYLKEIHALK